MTLEEYHGFSEIAIKLFNYMNGRINRMNNQCTLQIEMYDLVNGTYGNIRYPNHIYLNIGTIIDSFQPNWSIVIDRYDYICSLIAWALSHELHHADQLIAMLQYNINPAYKNKVEGDVERASYNWVRDHALELSRIGNFNVIINDITSDSLPDVGYYKKAEIREFYLQTIENILIRDSNAYRSILQYLEGNVTDVILFFNNIDNVVIKSNGNYSSENLNLFSSLVYKWAGYYDKYSISCYADSKPMEGFNGRILSEIRFDIKNQIIEGMIFKT